MDYETPTCIKCEREWAGDYPVCMLCAPDTHFPRRSDCIHCQMLTDLQSKDWAFQQMLEALEDLFQRLQEGCKGREVPEWLYNLDLAPAKAAIKAAKGE